MPEGNFPVWLEQRLVIEERFARAWASLSDRERAWLKACLARLYAWYGANPSRSDRCERVWDSGLRSCQVQEPLEWCLVRVKAADRSPSRLLAAILPPVLSGVNHVAVVAEASAMPWTDPQLVALELAGIEAVYALNPGEAEQLDRELTDKWPQGGLVELGCRPAEEPDLHAAKWKAACLRRLPVPSIGIWAEPGTDWDQQAMLFALQAETLQLWSSEEMAGQGRLPFRRGCWDEFLDGGFDTLFVPRQRVDSALGRAQRVFGPGQESSWLWPQLVRSEFWPARVAWTGVKPAEQP